MSESIWIVNKTDIAMLFSETRMPWLRLTLIEPMSMEVKEVDAKQCAKDKCKINDKSGITRRLSLIRFMS